jgi:arylsulfatase A-like enzyme
VTASYAVDRSWDRMWSYTFGLEELSPEELDLTRRTYDACLLELDQLFEQLLSSLEAAGELEDTIVVLVGDHGEHLGEQHMLDHQYSLYQGLVQVPLILWNPKRIQAGRSQAPVSNFDLFPTLLELCGLESKLGEASLAQSLLHPLPARQRLSEYPSDFEFPIRTVSATHPNWQADPWRRRLAAFHDAREKLIWASDGRHELYDLSVDPTELRNLASERAQRLDELQKELGSFLGQLQAYEYAPGANPDLSSEQRERLEALGYFTGEEEE